MAALMVIPAVAVASVARLAVVVLMNPLIGVHPLVPQP